MTTGAPVPARRGGPPRRARPGAPTLASGLDASGLEARTGRTGAGSSPSPTVSTRRCRSRPGGPRRPAAPRPWPARTHRPTGPGRLLDRPDTSARRGGDAQRPVQLGNQPAPGRRSRSVSPSGSPVRARSRVQRLPEARETVRRRDIVFTRRVPLHAERSGVENLDHLKPTGAPVAVSATVRRHTCGFGSEGSRFLRRPASEWGPCPRGGMAAVSGQGDVDGAVVRGESVQAANAGSGSVVRSADAHHVLRTEGPAGRWTPGSRGTQQGDRHHRAMPYQRCSRPRRLASAA
jgi:hypothetical protein